MKYQNLSSAKENGHIRNHIECHEAVNTTINGTQPRPLSISTGILNAITHTQPLPSQVCHITKSTQQDKTQTSRASRLKCPCFRPVPCWVQHHGDYQCGCAGSLSQHGT